MENQISIIQKFNVGMSAILMFLGVLHVFMLAGIYEPAITVSPAMAQAVAETVQAEYDSQRATIAKLNAPARKK